jgi:hypothetical protein
MQIKFCVWRSVLFAAAAAEGVTARGRDSTTLVRAACTWARTRTARARRPTPAASTTCPQPTQPNVASAHPTKGTPCHPPSPQWLGAPLAGDNLPIRWSLCN